jgi:hypothetical protein
VEWQQAYASKMETADRVPQARREPEAAEVVAK